MRKQEILTFEKKQSFINFINSFYKQRAQDYEKREAAGLIDNTLEEYLDYIFDTLLMRAYTDKGRIQYDFTDLLMDVLDDYTHDKDINYEETTPSGKTITITSLGDCFEYIFFLDLEGNLHQAIDDYLKYANESYNATLFFGLKLTFHVDDFYTEEQIQDICNWLTTNVLHNYYHLQSCEVFWDGEQFLLVDTNYTDLYTREKLYQYLLEYGKTLGYSSLEEFDWWMG